MNEVQVSIPAGEIQLAATLTMPDDGARAVPIVVCLHGTGPLDRDQNMPGQALDIFNTIAAPLADAGIACLRFDKRGCGESTGDYYTAGHFDLLDDAIAVIDYAQQLPSTGSTYLLGHSEGTLLAVEASLRRSVDGLVLLSPFIQDMEPLLRTQARRMEQAITTMPGWKGRLYRLATRTFANPVRAQEKLITRLHNSSEPAFGRGSGRVAAQALREMMSIDVEAAYRQVTVPALILGGAKDLQCGPDDVQRIADLLGSLATPVLVPDLTHILRRDAGEHTFFSYGSLIRQPMDREVARLVTDWLIQQELPHAGAHGAALL